MVGKERVALGGLHRAPGFVLLLHAVSCDAGLRPRLPPLYRLLPRHERRCRHPRRAALVRRARRLGRALDQTVLLSVPLRRYIPDMRELRLDSARVDSVVVEDLPNPLDGGHVVGPGHDEHVDRRDNLGLGELPAVELVDGEDARDLLDGCAEVVEGDGRGNRLEEDEGRGFDWVKSGDKKSAPQ